MVGGLFPWNDYVAVALRVAGEDARGMQGGTIANYKAKTVADLQAAERKYQHSPVNLIASDNNGDVLFHEGGPVAGVSDQQFQTCWSEMVPGTFNGSTSNCQWTQFETAAAEGLLGSKDQPSLIRSDYVANSNDTYWLANPEAPLSNYPLIVGFPGQEQTPRSRSTLTMIQQRLDGSDGQGNAGSFTRDSLLETMMSNQHYLGQTLRDDLVAMCEATPLVDLGEVQVDLTEACSVLKEWDKTAELDSVGSHIMREWVNIAKKAEGNRPSRQLPTKYTYRVPFNPADPVNTPRGLDIETGNNSEALVDLAKAVKKLNDAGIALDAKLGDIQFIERNGVAIPMHGGQEYEGIFNKMGFGNGSAEGYQTLNGSSASWVMATALTDNGPEVKALLALFHLNQP